MGKSNKPKTPTRDILAILCHSDVNQPSTYPLYNGRNGTIAIVLVVVVVAVFMIAGLATVAFFYGAAIQRTSTYSTGGTGGSVTITATN